MLPQFHDPSLFQTALTHRSSLNESTVKISNERLEFLGDAVLELATTVYLYNRFPEENEGVLSSYRSSLVKTTTLAGVAKTIGLDAQIRMSKGEEHGGGRANQSLLADTFEAVLGAMYLDQGYDVCVTFLEENLFPLFDEILEQQSYKDYKSTLQEMVQSKGKSTPVYTTVGEEGPDHLKTFTVEVSVDGEPLATGQGKSKQDASQVAAKSALEKMNKL